MNGREEYILKQTNKINSFIAEHNDKLYLVGFSNYIGDSRSANTKYNYLLYVNRFMESTQKELGCLCLDDYTLFLSNVPLSSKKPAYSALKAFSKYLKLNKINCDNPMDEIEPPKYEETEKTVARREKKYLTETEIHSYIESVNKGIGSHKAIARQEEWRLRDKAIIYLFLNTAMRSFELCSLDVNSLDFECGTVRFRKKGGGMVTHPLSENMRSLLAEWLEQREILLGEKEEDALFISSERARISYSAVRRIVQKYAENIEGKDITPHALRATVATQVCAQKGIYIAQQMLGHSTPTMTARIYVRGQENASKIEAASVMEKLTF